MTTGLREFTGWARLKMLSGLQEQRSLVKLNDAMVAAEMKKSFGDDIEMKKDDEMLVGRDFVQPNPQPIVIMQPPASAVPAPQSNAGWVVAILLAILLVAMALFGGVWLLLSQQAIAGSPPAATKSGEEYQVQFFIP